MTVDRTCYIDGGTYYEVNNLSLNYAEFPIIVSALQYYTDKRRLAFEERMLAGDMARKMSCAEVQRVEVEKE